MKTHPCRVRRRMPVPEAAEKFRKLGVFEETT
jgi:hypothetical protein